MIAGCLVTKTKYVFQQKKFLLSSKMSWEEREQESNTRWLTCLS